MIFIVAGIVQKTRTVRRKNKEKWENFDAWLCPRRHSQLLIVSGALIEQAKNVRCAFYVCIQKEGESTPFCVFSPFPIPCYWLCTFEWTPNVGESVAVQSLDISLSLHPPNYPASQWKSINLIWHLHKLTPLPTRRLLPHSLLAEVAAHETSLCWFRTFAFCLSLGFNCNFIFRFPGKNVTHSDF